MAHATYEKLERIGQLLLYRAAVRAWGHAERPPRKPWGIFATPRTTGLRFKCIGCGDLVNTEKHRYCRKCRRRLEAGLPTDLDEYLTDSECRGVAYGERTNRVRR